MPADACFGPKLFLGIPDDAAGKALTSVVAIYVKEKTGIETERIALGGKSVLQQIRGEKIDYGFSGQADDSVQVILHVDGLPDLVSGPRILQDLQFTTVMPALKRLQQLITPDHVERIRQDIEAGELPMAAARSLLMQKRWI